MSRPSTSRTPATTAADAAAGEGLLLVDKPAGRTSHDIVAMARRVRRERRVGHAGTLDPFATGLLVLLLGRTTRLLPYLQGEPKVYHATIRFGLETTTDDLTGEPSREAPLPELAAIEQGIGRLTGTQDQIPPAVSAKQVGGVRAHAAARRGQPLALRPSRVTVHAWEVAEVTPERVVARITCSGGTYVRALARDLGRLTGSAAHLAALRRLQSGPLSVDDAASIEQLADAPLRSPLIALTEMTSLSLDPAALARVRQGQAIPGAGDTLQAVLLDETGRLAGIAVRQGELWQPRVVL